jgi:hypothetical protein
LKAARARTSRCVATLVAVAAFVKALRAAAATKAADLLKLCKSNSSQAESLYLLAAARNEHGTHIHLNLQRSNVSDS